MTIFQKLSWMMQMGIRNLCGEEPHNLCQSSQPESSLQSKNAPVQRSKSALSATATHSLEGVGVIPAKVMCILEMPSAAEDKTGVPLSGEEGELLTKMLAAIGLDINTQTYVSYLSPWRSPGARLLTAVEIQEGMALLAEKIRSVHPQVLLLFGVQTAQTILGLSLGQARSKSHQYEEVPVFSTFAPRFLIKNSDYKKGAWADLKKLQNFLKEEK